MSSEILTLDRPLAAIDLEATGVDPQEARIIQVAVQRYIPAGEFDGVVEGDALTRIVDPEEEVADRILDLTGITEEQITEAHTLEFIAPALRPFLQDADLLGYNITGYDYPLLKAEYERLGLDVPGPEDRKVIDAYALEKQLDPKTLENVYASYTGRDLEDAHDASADVEATWEVLKGQCSRFDLKGATPADLVDTQRGDYLDDGQKLKEREDGAVEVCFGQYRGHTLRELQEEDRDYLVWMYNEISELKPFIDEVFRDG